MLIADTQLSLNFDAGYYSKNQKIKSFQIQWALSIHRDGAGEYILGRHEFIFGGTYQTFCHSIVVDFGFELFVRV